MSARGAAFASVVVLVALAALAAWLVGVPVAVIAVCSGVVLLVAGRRALARHRAAATPGPEEAPATHPPSGTSKG